MNNNSVVVHIAIYTNYILDFQVLGNYYYKDCKHLYHHYTNLTFVCDVCDVRAGGHGKPFDPS